MQKQLVILSYWKTWTKAHYSFKVYESECSCGKLSKTIPLKANMMLEPNPDVPWPAGIKVNKQLIQMPLKDDDNITVVAEKITDEEVTLTAKKNFTSNTKTN